MMIFNVGLIILFIMLLYIILLCAELEILFNGLQNETIYSTSITS